VVAVDKLICVETHSQNLMARQSRNFAAAFRDFLGTLPGAESLDDPSVLPLQATPERADYLLFQRSVIAEVKTLESDPAPKVETLIDRYRADPAFPLFYGMRPLNAVLEHLPPELQDKIRREVYQASTTAISGGCEKANRQIRETRAHFALPSAAGILFILNDNISMLSPNVLAARVHQQMHKRLRSGDNRFPEIAYVCVISWAHLIRTADGRPAHPILTVEGPAAANRPVAAGLMDYIIDAWSRSEAAQLFQAGPENLEDYELSMPEVPPQSNQEHWEAEYRANRHLAGLDLDALVEYGHSLLKEITHCFLGDHAQDQNSVAANMRKWTHLMEECAMRNLDLREVFRREI
jgi:hypothetical protein